MRIESIAFGWGGESTRSVAAKWLRGWEGQPGGPDWIPYPPSDSRDLDFEQAPLQVWLGSPVALGNHSVHRDEVSALGLMRALERVWAETPKHPYVRQQGYVPQLSFDVPAEVVDLWLESRSWQRLDIERAALTGVDAGLDQIRRNVRLASGEFAAGLAAVGAWTVDRGPDDDRSSPQVGAQALLVGVERSDGRVVPPDPTAAIDPGLARESADVARQVFSRELAKLGYSMELFGHSVELPGLDVHYVGRDSAWVRDPLDRYRDMLGGVVQQEGFDDRTTLVGEEITGLNDVALESLRRELSGAFEGVDGARAAYRARREASSRMEWDRSDRAKEDELLLSGRGASASAVLRERVELIEHEIAGRRYTGSGSPADGRSDRLAPADWDHAVSLVAVLREQAIRAEQNAGRESVAPPGAKRIGCGDVSAILERQRAREHERREAFQELDAAKIVTREEVDVPLAHIRLAELVGVERADALAEHLGPLRSWVEEQSDEWVMQRYAELGRPDAQLDRRTARLARLNEAARERVSALLEVARGEEERLDVGDLVEVQRREVARHERELDRLDKQAHILREQGHDLDDWVVRDGDRVMRAIVYADEVNIRRELGIAQAAERAAVDPPRHITEQLGPAPERGTSERHEWEALTREVEYKRLAAEADQATGEQLHVRPAQAERVLEERIERWREQRGLAPQRPEQAREVAFE